MRMNPAQQSARSLVCPARSTGLKESFVIAGRYTDQGRSATSRQNRADSGVSPAHAKERRSAARLENHSQAAAAARFSGRTVVWKKKGKSEPLQPEKQCQPDF